jgi:hypothetical protein
VGGAAFDPAQQLRQNAVQILQYVQITETQHLQPLALQMRCTQPISREPGEPGEPSRVMVLPDIELDHQPQPMQALAVRMRHVQWAFHDRCEFAGSSSSAGAPLISAISVGFHALLLRMLFYAWRFIPQA